MANAFLKPSVIAATAVGLLYRELVVAKTVWTDAIRPEEFTGALNDTVNMRIPARRAYRTRVLRAGTAITNDVSNEFSVPVVLDTDVYNGAPITDEELTLDIVNFGLQVLQPQTRAVAEGVEDMIIDEIQGATYPAGMTINADATDMQVSSLTDWYFVFARAARLLDDQNVSKLDRYAIVANDVAEQIRRSDRFTRFDSQGQTAADTVRTGAIGEIAGFQVIPTSGIESGQAFCYHRTAFVLATRAPKVPQGATFGQSQSLGDAPGEIGYVGGIGARWLMDYDYTNTTDRSLVDTYVGTATVLDADTPSNPASTKSLKRAVKITNGS